MDERSAGALARLAPLLGCGEEAAVLAFDGLARTCGEDAHAEAILAEIAREEREHDAILRGLRAALPPVEGDPAVLRATRRFHMDVAQGGPALQLARIAALDAAVCTVLGLLLASRSPLSADADVAAALRRIRHDEARHVAASRRLTLAASNRRPLRNAAVEARESLAGLLMLGAAAFELLGVDPDALRTRIRRLPDRLLPA